ncbi:MAG: hypothetical protein R2731_00050 [Nocardioides sp.]
MTPRTQQTHPRRWLLPFLAALIAALAAILSGTTASATPMVGAETRVGAFNVAGEVLVGPPQHVSAGQGRDAAENQPQIVVAPVLPDEGAGGFTSLTRASPAGRSASDFEHGYNPAEFPGGPGSEYPDGRAYFGVNDSSIAKEYAQLGSYDSNVIETRIPNDIF